MIFLCVYVCVRVYTHHFVPVCWRLDEQRIARFQEHLERARNALLAACRHTDLCVCVCCCCGMRFGLSSLERFGAGHTCVTHTHTHSLSLSLSLLLSINTYTQSDKAQPQRTEVFPLKTCLRKEINELKHCWSKIFFDTAHTAHVEKKKKKKKRQRR